MVRLSTISPNVIVNMATIKYIYDFYPFHKEVRDGYMFETNEGEVYVFRYSKTSAGGLLYYFVNVDELKHDDVIDLNKLKHPTKRHILHTKHLYQLREKFGLVHK